MPRERDAAQAELTNSAKGEGLKGHGFSRAEKGSNDVGFSR